MEKLIQIAVVRADLILCQIASLSWGRIMVVVAILVIFGGVVRKL